jgi:hypothetical protein
MRDIAPEPVQFAVILQCGTAGKALAPNLRCIWKALGRRTPIGIGCAALSFLSAHRIFPKSGVQPRFRGAMLFGSMR